MPNFPVKGTDSEQRQFHRDQDLIALAAREDNGVPSASPTLLAATTTVTTYPTSATAYYACNVQDLLGAETEGAAGVLSAASPTRRVMAYNLGTAIPTVGTLVVLTFVGNRWVFRFDG